MKKTLISTGALASSVSVSEAIKYLMDKKLVQRLGGHYQSYLKDNREDFEEDLWEIILNIPEDKLNTLYQNKQLDFYILSIARNQITNDKSNFNKLYQTKINKVDLDFILDNE